MEAAQAGLSWYTVLRKRDSYRDAFAGFDPQKVARYGKKQIEALLKNPGIIRNRLKIAAAVNNAGKFLQVQNEFGSFDAYIWRFVDGKPIVNRLKTLKDYPATSRESDALSKDLKQRGFKFVGSTIIYAHMQATGMVNDHVEGCFRRKPIIAEHDHHRGDETSLARRLWGRSSLVGDPSAGLLHLVSRSAAGADRFSSFSLRPIDASR